MQELTYERKPMNVAQLDGEFRAAFEARYHGLSTDQNSIRFFFDDDLSKEDTAAAAALYEAHTPEETDEQAETHKRAAKRELRQLLRNFDDTNVRSLADIAPYLKAAFRLLAQDD